MISPITLISSWWAEKGVSVFRKCEEYEDLKKAIDTYRRRRNKYSVQSMGFSALINWNIER